MAEFEVNSRSSIDRRFFYRVAMIYKCAVIFICAVLLLLTAETSGEKYCRVRNNPLYPRDIWDYWTSFYCYNYTNKYRLKPEYLSKFLPTSIVYRNYTIPITQLENGSYITYDYKDNNTLKYLKEAFKSDYFFQMWIDCCEEAADCCDNHMTNENIIGTEEYPCPAIWDGWTCFGLAKPGTIEERLCSSQAYSTQSDVCELNSQKECFANGTWNQQTNYETCAMAPVLRNRHRFNVIMLAVATVLSFPAVVVFFSLRTFRKNVKYILHRNLILVIVLRNLLTIMSKQIIILDALKISGSNDVMSDNSVACRVLAFFENAAKNGMYACMLADGFYLHKLIVRAFANEPSLVYIYIAVGVLSFLPSITWAIARGVHNGEDCWMVDETGDQWIIDGFRIAMLSINFLLLLDIIRVMAMKLKRGSTSHQTKATLRATLFLIPLFGIHIIIITNRNIVPSNTCVAEDIYYYLSYVIEGIQGIMVALLFCYINAEVRKELGNALRKFVLYLDSRFDIKFNLKKDFRRTTAATFVDPYSSQ